MAARQGICICICILYFCIFVFASIVGGGLRCMAASLGISLCLRRDCLHCRCLTSHTWTPHLNLLSPVFKYRPIFGSVFVKKNSLHLFPKCSCCWIGLQIPKIACWLLQAQCKPQTISRHHGSQFGCINVGFTGGMYQSPLVLKMCACLFFWPFAQNDKSLNTCVLLENPSKAKPWSGGLCGVFEPLERNVESWKTGAKGCRQPTALRAVFDTYIHIINIFNGKFDRKQSQKLSSSANFMSWVANDKMHCSWAEA